MTAAIPKVAEESADPQRDKVHSAHEYVAEIYPEADVPAGDLEKFAAHALEAAGWSMTTPPEFVLDVADDAEWSGWHEGRTREIHLHPRLLSPWLVLHELAHWVDPRDHHGPRFCANFVSLVHGAIGRDAARELLAEFDEAGADVDRDWLPNLADSVRTGGGP